MSFKAYDGAVRRPAAGRDSPRANRAAGRSALDIGRWRIFLARQLGAGMSILLAFLTVLLVAPVAYGAAVGPANEKATELKLLSLEQLMDIEITSVSKRVEQLSRAPSAIQVITDDMIRRSGATNLPEALRLASNLQVAQLNSHEWAITARGFNSSGLGTAGLADKLQVMIDGRSVYTPLFAGVYWDAQHVLLEDLDRIEVVSGPGGNLWGSNAVNGVINIVSKNAQDTQGWYVSGSAGTQVEGAGAVRYGGRAGDDVYYRIYGQRQDRNAMDFLAARNQPDDWDVSQGGFRVDYRPSAIDAFTLQGDAYSGHKDGPVETGFDGQNLIGRWTRALGNEAEFTLQFYVDRTWRDAARADSTEDLRTYDIDFRHQLAQHGRHRVIWGAGYRYMDDEAQNATGLASTLGDRDFDLVNAFVQDEISLIGETLRLSLGIKFEHNEFSGTEWQPSARLAWHPVQWQTYWAAVSRAVRSPSRIEVDQVLAGVSAFNDDFDAEILIAYELGWRAQPTSGWQISLAAFYNDYDELRSVNFSPTRARIVTIGNDNRANTWGVELFTRVQLRDWWRLRASYTYLHQDIDPVSRRVMAGFESIEANDPAHQASLNSRMDLPGGFEFDLMGRYVDTLAPSVIAPKVPSYVTFDARIAWHYEHFEFALTGQNLAQHEHREFSVVEIPRAVYGTVSWRF